MCDIAEDEDELLDSVDQLTVQSEDEASEDRSEIIDLNVSQASGTQRTSNTNATRKKTPTQSFQDEFLSDDDTPAMMIQPETRSITLIPLLERVFRLLERCRQLVSDTRNIGVVQSFVAAEISGRKHCFTLDMRVSRQLLFAFDITNETIIWGNVLLSPLLWYAYVDLLSQ